MKSLFLLVLCLFMRADIVAQEGHCPKLPVQYAWETGADYEKDRDLVKKTLRWLCQTPLAVDVQQRSLANAFVLEWLTGVPSVTIEIKTENLPFYKSNPDLLFTFIHGMALYKMDHEDEKNEVTLYCKGFETVSSLALQSKELSKEHDLKPLLKATRKQKLREYVKELLQKK